MGMWSASSMIPQSDQDARTNALANHLAQHMSRNGPNAGAGTQRQVVQWPGGGFADGLEEGMIKIILRLRLRLPTNAAS